jgi:glucan 1,3-beta-glucosidase
MSIPEWNHSRPDAPHGAWSSEASAKLNIDALRGVPWTPVATQLTDTGEITQLEQLRHEFRKTLEAGMHGLCFSPFVDGQGPDSEVSALQIRERMRVIAPYTKWIRTFSCCKGSELMPAIAHEFGLKTLVGAWLGTDDEINEREIAAVIEVGKAGHADRVAVGNEVLLREDMDEDRLLHYIQRVKDALPNVEVGYVDAYYLFEKHPRITDACDVIFTNCYPFWEGCAREGAVAYMQSMVERTLAVAKGKPVVISETGWPDKGSPFHGAQPSPAGAMAYFIDSKRWASAAGIEMFYFSSFDEAWKVGAEGDVGAYWGLWDSKGQLKY